MLSKSLPPRRRAMRRNSFHFFDALIHKVCPFSGALLCAVSAALYLTACGGGTTGNIQTVAPGYSANVIYNFGASPDGNGPAVGVVLDNKGNLYGTTAHGGTFGEGTVFELTPNEGQWTEKVLYSFCHPGINCSDGSQPTSKLTFDSAGNLYGTASQGGSYRDSYSGIGYGVVFELIPQQDGTWTEAVLYSFQGDTHGDDGADPEGGALLFDNVGNLYGTTKAGGYYPDYDGFLGFANGTVFELSPASSGPWTEQLLFTFCYGAGYCNPSEGAGKNPQDGLIFDSSGNLYGTTRTGPPIFPSWDPGYGAVFGLGWTTNGCCSQWPLFFGGGPADGATPVGGLVVDSTGVFYGTTAAGGSSTLSPDSGTVFKLMLGTNGKWSDGILYNFCSQPGCADGSNPATGVVLDQSGNLYGTTLNGGASNAGVVFKLIPQSDGTWKQSTLYTFQGSDKGYGPVGLTVDSSGNLYVVARGGTTGSGMVLELVPQSAE
jgi:uncharacterized repeat protein (TIGR03803 family)